MHPAQQPPTMSAAAAFPPRRKKTSQERRDQRARADGRMIQRIIKSVSSLNNHGGSRPTKLGSALVEALLKGHWNVEAPVFVPYTTGVSAYKYNDNLPHDDSGYDGDGDNDNKGTMGEVVVPKPPPLVVEVEASPSPESESTEQQAPHISGRVQQLNLLQLRPLLQLL